MCVHLIALLLPGFVIVPQASATLWTVQMGGSPLTPGELPYYSPQFLTIEAGDQVRWSNQSGIHSVNGSLATFPGNPEGFFSGLPQGGMWTWTFTFTIPGTYDYHCDGDGHAATQFGTITVLDPTGILGISDADDVIHVHPTPTTDLLRIDWKEVAPHSLAVISLNGETVMHSTLSDQPTTTLDVRALRPANYFLLITDRNGRVIAKPFTKL